jgi:signal transduction histidine kinase
VSDTGIGIDPDALEHVFERFYRADDARTRAFGGAGLGLSIAEQLATGHGGRISAESTPGHGSTFTVTLPLDPG